MFLSHLSFLLNVLAVFAINANHSDMLIMRDGSARFTYYQPGLGACGKVNGPSDHIVALNAPQWDGGSHCFDMITISYNGHTTTAQIVDLCPGCSYYALDLSPGLFSIFSDLSAGEIYGSWQYGTSSPPSPPPSSKTTSAVASTSLSTASSTIASAPTPTSPQVLAAMQMAILGLGGIMATSQE